MSATLQNAIFKGRYKEALTRYLELEKSILQCLVTTENDNNKLQYNYFPSAEEEIDRQQLTVSQVILHNLVRMATTNSKPPAAIIIKFSAHEKNLNGITDFITLEKYIKSNETTILPPNISHVLKTSHRIASDVIEKNFINNNNNNFSATSISNFENASRYFEYLGLKLHEYCINDVSRWSRLSSKQFKRLYELTKECMNLYEEKQQWMVEIENYVNKHKTLMEKLCQEQLEKVNTDNDRLRNYIVQLETKMKNNTPNNNDISNLNDVEMNSVTSEQLLVPRQPPPPSSSSPPPQLQTRQYTQLPTTAHLKQQQQQPDFDNEDYRSDNIQVTIPRHIYQYFTEIENLIKVLALYRNLMPFDRPFMTWEEEIKTLEQQIELRHQKEQTKGN